MKFGLWDHVDRSDRMLARQLDERLEFLAAGDEAGFYCFHVAEHHATPLNLVPIPGVYLGAVAQRTKRMRLGPLTYLLPLYSPLRLIEEICILDHLSHGRLEIGIGRGVSAFELNYHNIDVDTAREVFAEVFGIVRNGLTNERLNHQGKYFTYKNVPMELTPFQKPYPRFWYPSSSPQGAAYAGENGLNYVTLGPMEKAKANLDSFRSAYKKCGTADVTNSDFAEGVAMGVNRHIVVADTDDAAMKIARPAHDQYYASLTKLQREHIQGPTIAASSPADLESALRLGTAIVGSPDTVCKALAQQIRQLGLNYMTVGMFFGTMSFADAMRSLTLFAQEIMPALMLEGSLA